MKFKLEFRMISGAYMPENEDVIRVIEADGKRGLKELCGCLLDSLRFDFDHMYEFEIGDLRFTGSFVENHTEETLLEELVLGKNSKFSLTYDFGDSWMFGIVVKEVDKTSEERCLKVVESIGEAEQYPDLESWEADYYARESDKDLSPEQKEISDGVERFELLVFNDQDETAAEEILKLWPVIKRYVTGISGERGKLTVEEADPDHRLDLWNCLMESDLVFLNQKRYEEGIRLWKDILETFHWKEGADDQLNGAIGEALARLGRREEMEMHFSKWQERSPDSLDRMNYHLLALEELKSWEEAGQLVEKYLKAAEDESLYGKELLLNRAIEIFEALGDENKCDFYALELEEYEEKRRRLYEKSFSEFTQNVPVTRSYPKIYPNDPCPCGSGKKFKKCCGKNKP